jgi:hypothetical protein
VASDGLAGAAPPAADVGSDLELDDLMERDGIADPEPAPARVTQRSDIGDEVLIRR